MQRNRIWYIAVNARAVRLLSESSKVRTPVPDEITFDVPRRKQRDVLPDRPARSFAPARGRRRSSVEPATDPIEEDKKSRFLREIVEFLEREHNKAGSFERIAFIAPES